MRLLRSLFSLGIVLIGTACSLSPVNPTSEIQLERSATEVALLIEERARACWARPSSFWRDGIRVDSQRLIAPIYTISASRFAPDIGQREPFFTVEVLESAAETAVLRMSEGDFACSMVGTCAPLGFTADVGRWLDGDHSCRPL